MHLHRRLTLLLGTAGALAAAGPADAATFCVGKAECPGGTAVSSVDEAIDKTKASPGADRVEIGAGTFEAGTGTPAGDPIEIVGAGRDQTVLTTSRFSPVIRLTNAGSSIRDLALHTSGKLAALDAGAPITAERLRVTGTPELSTGGAIVLRDGGTVRDTQVDIGLDQQYSTTGIGVWPDPGKSIDNPVVIEDVQVTAKLGIEIRGGTVGPVAVRNARVRGYVAGVGVQSPAPNVTVEGLSAHLADHPEPGNAGSGVLVEARDGDVSLTLRRSTLVSRDAGGQGLRIWQYSAGPVTVNARDVLLVGSRTWAPGNQAEADFETYGTGSGPVNLTLEHSAWRDGATRLYHPNLHYQFTKRANVDLTKSPLNVADLEAGDFRPVAGSVLVDNGSPGDAPHAQDGDGDGAAVQDIGAFEAAPGTNAGHVTPAFIPEPCTNVTQCGAKNGDPGAATLTASSPRALRGIATRDGNVAAVEVAITRKRGGRCQTLTQTGRWVATGNRCKPRFLRAAGTTSWSLRLKRALPRGTYAVHVRVLDGTGKRGAASPARTIVIR
jgi:hypothetical protein